MKIKLFMLLLLLLGLTNLYAQSLYVPGAVVKGKNAAYRCIADSKLLVKVRNVSNVDTTWTMFYTNGSAVPPELDLVAESMNKREDLYNIFREVLTSAEWNTLKGKSGYLLIIDVVVNTQGHPTELSFRFRSNDPVMTQMFPDRFYLLEQKLKEVIKVKPGEMIRSVRNFKFFRVISYRDMY